MNIQISRDIRAAIKQGNLEKVIGLIANDKERLNFSTSVFGTWLHVAANAGQLDIVQYFVEAGIDINQHGGIFEGSPINEAASKGHLEIVKYLLSCGAELDVSDPVRNPLFSAITGGHIKIVKFLIDSGIDIHVKYENGRDALAYAIERGENEIADLIRDAMGGK
ncbi:ankyrin repeat domain-containing protein [Anaerosinus massiliensis]|uniref:ankyrin repeat domain-containing protein n=1 Tax=Massilibacillus massiliensis TaxID=1806837 RepID=UPI000AD7E1F5|nr:ankyrin repeat domain-containing protein [Massilibacillus massiliensis]